MQISAVAVRAKQCSSSPRNLQAGQPGTPSSHGWGVSKGRNWRSSEGSPIILRSEEDNTVRLFGGILFALREEGTKCCCQGQGVSAAPWKQGLMMV